jgi:hypothetical protein
MKNWEKKIVPITLAFSTVLFLFAAFKPVIKGEPLNVAFLSIGVICFVLAIATRRKSQEGSGPPNV